SALAAGLLVVTVAACGRDERSAPVRSSKANDAVQPVAAHPVAATATVASSSDVAPVAAPAPPTPVVVSYGGAEQVFRSGDYGQAADLFQAYAEQHPDNPWGPYMEGIAAWRAGDHERAEAALRKTLELAPDHRKGLLNLARVLLEEGKASDALEPAEGALALDSLSGESWRVLGNVRSELGKVDDAVAAYRMALGLDHRDAWTMNNLGLLMIREGRYEEALPPLARAAELRPDVARFQNNLGIALERTGHLAEAADAFKAALAVRTDYDKAQVSLDRVQARADAAPSEPLDLAELARTFADTVTAWQNGQNGLQEPVPEVATVPPDSVGG
ncbi:MAG: tetratricopeptide repeat protein, partial [Gemmatimonadota bacterium]